MKDRNFLNLKNIFSKLTNITKEEESVFENLIPL